VFSPTNPLTTSSTDDRFLIGNRSEAGLRMEHASTTVMACGRTIQHGSIISTGQAIGQAGSGRLVRADLRRRPLGSVAAASSPEGVGRIAQSGGDDGRRVVRRGCGPAHGGGTRAPRAAGARRAGAPASGASGREARSRAGCTRDWGFGRGFGRGFGWGVGESDGREHGRAPFDRPGCTKGRRR